MASRSNHPRKKTLAAPDQRPRSSVRVKRAAGGQFCELVHPPCVQQRTDDLAEVHAMLALGEIDVATDELRWLLDDCRDFIEAHKLLGELAVADGDANLARAHFGYAYDLGLGALPAKGLEAPLAYQIQANQPFLEAAKGLAWSLVELDQRDKAREVLEQLLKCDPSDPLHAREMLASL